MDDKEVWATDLARKVMDRHEKNDLAKKQLGAEQELLGTSAPVIWDELQNEVKSRVEALNLALRPGHSIEFLHTETNKFELRFHDRESGVIFDFERKMRLNIHQVNTGWTFDLQVVKGKLVWVSRQLGTMSSEQVAKFVLEDTAKFI
jgi:hypothetical protein